MLEVAVAMQKGKWLKMENLDVDSNGKPGISTSGCIHGGDCRIQHED
jgi:hypothetical protein